MALGHSPVIEQLESDQLPGPLGPADPLRVVLRPATPCLVVVDVVAVSLVPALAPSPKKREEQPVILHVRLPGSLRQEREPRPAEEPGQPRINPVLGIDQYRRPRLDAQRPLPVVNVGPLIEQVHPSDRDLSTTRGPVQLPLTITYSSRRRRVEMVHSEHSRPKINRQPPQHELTYGGTPRRAGRAGHAARSGARSGPPRPSSGRSRGRAARADRCPPGGARGADQPGRCVREFRGLGRRAQRPEFELMEISVRHAVPPRRARRNRAGHGPA